MKLKLDLIPEGSWYSNLRKAMGDKNWILISRNYRNLANKTCQYCGWREDRWKNEKGLYTHLHEVWWFDEKKHIQKLIGFECVCPDCHMVHHWGFAQVKGLDMDRLMNHACKVNGCTRQEFQKHIADSFEEWGRRSQIEWQIDLGKWNPYVEKMEGKDEDNQSTE